MYNHRMAPHVSHFRGTELMIEYIEKYICPTVTSAGPFARRGGLPLPGRPAAARRAHGYEDEYHSAETLPCFAHELSDRFGCYCSFLLGDPQTGIRGLEELLEADALVLYVRPRPPKGADGDDPPLPRSQEPLVGLRTACHAFDIKKAAPPGMATWPTFDPDVLGGHYRGHTHPDRAHRNHRGQSAAGHPILAEFLPAGQWMSTATLYNVLPIDPSAKVLLLGKYKEEIEPVAWTRDYQGSRVFFTSLGHVDDFQTPRFETLLVNALFWAMDKPVPQGR